jgi:AcrR family transcriptional regulator
MTGAGRAVETGRSYGAKLPAERRAERRARLLAAGLEAFGGQGYAAASIEQLCATAGVSTRNFYEEFESREALLIALHDDLNDRALQAVVAAIANLPETDLEGRAREGVEAYFRVMTSDRRWARIALVESVGLSAAAEAARRAAIARFADLLHAQAERLGRLGVIPRRDYALTATALVGAINGLVSTWTADDEWDAKLPKAVDEAVRLIVVAVRAEQ